MARSKVTIRDVAADAGVSRQTVSRVINGSEHVDPTTRSRILISIETLGYQPNAVARSMARGRTGMLACISPNVTDYTFASIIAGAQTLARSAGYFLLAAAAPDEASFNQLMDQLVKSGRVEGLIVIQPYIEDRNLDVPAGYPTVFAGGGAHANQHVGGSVVLDDVAAARDATNHLISLGHRSIGMITGPLDEVCVQNRMLGFEQALCEANLPLLPELVIEGDWSALSGDHTFRNLWQNTAQRPSALFVQNDLMAAGVLHAARELAVELPQQLSIISIDDLPLTPFLDPPLTTMKQDFAAIGRNAAQLLTRALEHDQNFLHHKQIKAQLVPRRSTAKATVAASYPEGGDC